MGQNGRYAGRRFAAFLISSALLVVGLLIAEEKFANYATALTTLYIFYLGGQSATDYVKAKNGHAPV